MSDKDNESYLRKIATGGSYEASPAAWAVAELTRLRAEVQEWLCADCNVVYPGPPAEGLACIICPECRGMTGPRLGIENRKHVAELARLREFEAREAMVVNLMAAWVDVIDNKMTRDRFEELLKRSEAEMCRAIECLGRRDKIRKLEGKLEVLRTLRERYHDARPPELDRWVSAVDIEQSLGYYSEELEEARGKK